MEAAESIGSAEQHASLDDVPSAIERSEARPIPARSSRPPRAEIHLGVSERGARLPVVLVASAVTHAALFAVLAILPTPHVAAANAERFEIEMLVPAAPPPVVEPPPPPPPAIEPEPVARQVVRPAAVIPEPPRAIEPTPEPTPAPSAAALPSVDDVFAEPPPAAPVLVAEGGSGGGFTVAAGATGGAAGGVSGGRGNVPGAGSAAPAGPSAEAIRRARSAYVSSIGARVRRAIEERGYPMVARRSHVEGRVRLGLRIGRDGRLIGVRVTSSSGSVVLDDSALAAARDVGAYPAPPELIAWDPAREVEAGGVYELQTD